MTLRAGQVEGGQHRQQRLCSRARTEANGVARAAAAAPDESEVDERCCVTSCVEHNAKTRCQTAGRSRGRADSAGRRRRRRRRRT